MGSAESGLSPASSAAIAESSLYDDMLRALAARKDLSTTARYEKIAIRDIQDAADLLRPVYQATNRRDGYVSLEVSPKLARNTQGTIAEARRLWQAVNRENVMIKVPGTPEGAPAIRQLIGEGALGTVYHYEAHTSKWLRPTSKDWKPCRLQARTSAKAAAWPAFS